MPDEEIALSIEETNALRTKLGLAPLGTEKALYGDTSINVKENSEISLSVDESNELRSRLGLKPLTLSKSATDGTKFSAPIHMPAQKTRDHDDVKRRLEEARLKREVERGIKKFEDEADEEYVALSALSWAEKMRIQSNSSDEIKIKSAKIAKEGKVSNGKNYTDADFEDQNLIVSHSLGDFNSGDTRILTLADKTIMEAEDNEENELENVNMTESAVIQDNLKRKRMMEMGHGHAGGYTGYDDDEFDELGGSQMTLGISLRNGDVSDIRKKTGFKLGTKNHSKINSEENDVLAGLRGKNISLDGNNLDIVHQTDFMTYEEEELNIHSLNKDDIEFRRKKKEKKMLKKLKKESKKLDDLMVHESDLKVDSVTDEKQQSNLLLNLVNFSSNQRNEKKRKRHRERKTDESDDEEFQIRKDVFKAIVAPEKMESVNKEILASDKYTAIMEKGNERSQRTFGTQSNSLEKIQRDDDEADDDAFLHTALSKARRLQRLKELNTDSSSISIDKHANVVVESLQAMHKASDEVNNTKNSLSDNKIVFKSSATTEFTSVLRSKESDIIRSVEIPKYLEAYDNDHHEMKDLNKSYDDENAPYDFDDESLQKISTQIRDDDHDGAFGSTANSVGVGRGMSAFLGLLRQTGEISSKNSGREELRGRAKDERTYDDYEPLDLKNVVKIDTSGSLGKPHAKDVELASREVKLEYRDEHGRLLTRKEAYRQLCYQFHGHGASKKNEERRLQQIERENKDRSSKPSTATLLSLQAAQKASGKAFVIHKT